LGESSGRFGRIEDEKYPVSEKLKFSKIMSEKAPYIRSQNLTEKEKIAPIDR
jgi:hypothetical protein